MSRGQSSWRSGWRCGVGVSSLALLALTILLAGLVPASSAATEEQVPLGKQRFAIAVGDLRTDSVENWVRLGLYDFADDGTVSEKHWHWSQRVWVNRAYTGFQASDCPSRDCDVQTAGGFQSTGASKTLEGTYTVTADTLRITWNGGQWEEWTLTETAGGALAAVEFAGSSFGVTHGFGYGSNAAWDARASTEEIATADHSAFVHRYHLWKTTGEGQDPFIDEGDGEPFWVQDWSACGEECLGAVTGENTTQYYVAPANDPTGHRRDTLWGWRTANADGRDEYCYTGNSHVKPMIQVVDDNGVFHGWVGVEGSLNQTTDEGALGDDIGVFRIFG